MQTKLFSTHTRLVATVRDVTEQAVREMVDAGVSAILPHRTLTVDNLISSLRSVVAGNVALPADMLARLLVHWPRLEARDG